MQRIRRPLRDRKAISPVIAALLLIAISVAAGVVTYSWVMTMINTQGSQAQTAVRIDVVEFKKSDGTKDTIKITVRNTGSVAATIATIYLTYPNNTVITLEVPSDVDAEGGSGVISAGETKYFEISLDGDGDSKPYWEVSQAYKIKVVTDNGFAAEGTYYSPSS